jgi:hypothetical protein
MPDHIPLSPARKASRFFGWLMRPAVARKIATLATEGYLHEVGWMQSMATARVVDKNGAPIPWLSYPSVDLLTPRLKKTLNVFEYGAGASTCYFASKVGTVSSVEHDESFAESLRQELPENANLMVRAAGSKAYAEALIETSVKPDIVLVDGVDRERCIQVALEYLPVNAVLILDDAERREYASSVTLLLKHGFRRIEFWGLAPGVVRKKCTTIFYRAENGLAL